MTPHILGQRNGILDGQPGAFAGREVRGVSAWMVVFMLAWGLWNLYYYPSLGQWGSFFGGLSVAAANITWIALIFYYRKPR